MRLQVLCCKKFNVQEIRNSKVIDKKLVRWAVVTSIFVTSCLSHIYAEPFLTYEPKMLINDCNSSDASNLKGVEILDITLYHSFDPEAHTGGEHHPRHQHKHHHRKKRDKSEDHEHEHNLDLSNNENGSTDHDSNCDDEHRHSHYEDEEPFCCVLWLKIVFLSGFALSQFSIGSILERQHRFTSHRFAAKTLIISGMIASNAGNVYLFAIAWFCVTFMCSSIHLIVFCHFMEALDATEVWTWRLVGGLAFQFNWSFSRFLADLIVYLSNDWMIVISVITILISASFFYLEHLICVEEKFCNNTSLSVTNDTNLSNTTSETGLLQVIYSSKIMYLMTLVLSFTWFVIGFNYYGLLHSWCKISNAHKKFENDCLSAMLGFMAEILALLVCFIVKRKRLPLTILQIFSAITYFIMTSIDLDEGSNNKSTVAGLFSFDAGSNSLIYVVHILSFLQTAAFALIWCITVEVFPKTIRTKGLGLCSGIGRLGAILGIILGQYKKLHLSTPVRVVAGASALISAFLILVLPDLTKQKMPCTVNEIETLQFSGDRRQEQIQQNSGS